MYANVRKEREAMMHFQGISRSKLAFDVVVIAGSAGAIPALQNLLGGLPEDLSVPVLVVQHLPSTTHFQSMLPCILGRSTPLEVKWAEQGEQMRPRTVFLAPQDRDLTIDKGGMIHLTTGKKISRFCPAADVLFTSAARSFGSRTIGIVLSGTLWDGAEGCRAIAQAKGRVLVQERASCEHFDMPRAASAVADFLLTPAMIAHALVSLIMAPGAAEWLRVFPIIPPPSRALLHTASVPLWCEDPVLP